MVLSGPSGVGKDAIVRALKRRGRPIHITVTATTRPRRPGERDGVDYYFVSPERFREMQQQGELLEWAEVYGAFYGVPRGPLGGALSRGEDVLVKTDVQGAATIRQLAPQALLIFVVPPSLEELHQRLRQRETEAEETRQQRLSKAREEMAHLPEFDYVVVNHDQRLALAVAQIEAIITAEKCRVVPRRVQL